MSVVLKFGGTSVADAKAMRCVLNVVQEEFARTGSVVCVVSATAGTTNELLNLARRSALPSTVVADLCEPIRTRHVTIARELISEEHAPAAIQLIHSLADELERYCSSMHILEECTSESLDAVASFGERLCSAIITCALQDRSFSAVEVPATALIKTDSTFTQAHVYVSATNDACTSVLGPYLDTNTIVVTQGFAGSDGRGHTTTLGRGGSDASAAIIGAAIQADRIEIWTDVSGVYSADPRLVPSAKPIPSLSFGEIRELALYGAKVLHPDTIVPAVNNNIPVLIKNTFCADAVGTVITKDVVLHGTLHATSIMRPCIAVSGNRVSISTLGQTELLRSKMIFHSASFEHGIAVFHTPNEEVVMALAVATAGKEVHSADCAVIVCTGPSANKSTVIQAIATAVRNLDVRAVSAGTSPWSVFAVVGIADAEEALHALHTLAE